MTVDFAFGHSHRHRIIGSSAKIKQITPGEREANQKKWAEETLGSFKQSLNNPQDHQHYLSENEVLWLEVQLTKHHPELLPQYGTLFLDYFARFPPSRQNADYVSNKISQLEQALQHSEGNDGLSSHISSESH